MYREGTRARASDFVDDSQSEGSLWASNGQTNYFFTKNKVRAVGDIVTVVMGDRLIKDVATELKKTLSQEELEQELIATEHRLAEAALSGKKKDGTRRPATQQAEPMEEEEAAPIQVGLADVDLTPAMGIQAGEPMMAEIIERYPNGNYKVRATKRVPFRGGTRMVTLVAIARGQDVNNSETVESANLYEYRIKAYR
jgi:flagellar basal body L-ring protein FlgH